MEEVIGWYEELEGFEPDPITQVHLAVLEGESGRLGPLQRRIQGWEAKGEPLRSFSAILRTSYLGEASSSEGTLLSRALLTEVLPSGNIQEKLTLRWSSQVGQKFLFSQTMRAVRSRIEWLRWRYRLFLGLNAGLLVLALAALLAVWRVRKKWNFKVGSAPLPPHWKETDGWVVLIRGGAMGASLAILLMLMWEGQWIEFVAGTGACMPVLILAYRHLLKPSSLNFSDGFGFVLKSRGYAPLGLLMLAGIAVSSTGGWCLMHAAALLGLSGGHWSEWFNPRIAWGSGWTLAVTTFDYAFWVPLLEEAIFRGLLFSTLRRRFGWAASAALSAGLFSVAHGYGLFGFIGIFWSGVVWAWMYERTRSLIPCVCMHGMDNLLFSANLALLFRIA